MTLNKSTLEDVVESVMQRSKNDSNRLAPLADYAKEQLEFFGLPDVQGGTGGELRVKGMARAKNWDVAYEFAGKARLLISLKSLWRNASGTVPNRIDEIIGEAANAQQMAPELVTGYILVFDTVADSVRQADKKLWSTFFEEAIKKLTIRQAPIWNQGLLEGTWFIKIDSEKPYGKRILEPDKAEEEGRQFFVGLLSELKLREPAIHLTRPLP